MTQLGDRAVYTRTDLMSQNRLGRSVLEKWYRDRTITGHPEAAGKVGRALVWDAEEWDAWYRARHETAGLVDIDVLAEMVGRSRSTLTRLWEQREDNHHPAPRKRVNGLLYWDPADYRRWFTDVYLTTPGNRSRRVNFAAVGDDGIPGSRPARRSSRQTQWRGEPPRGRLLN